MDSRMCECDTADVNSLDSLDNGQRRVVVVGAATELWVSVIVLLAT